MGIMNDMLKDLPEKCLVVFDGTSYYIVPTDHEFQEDEEIEKEFDCMQDADDFCEKENYLNNN